MQYTIVTTKEHFDKYAKMAGDLGVTLKAATTFLGISLEPCNYAKEDTRTPDGRRVTCNACWACMFRIDPRLNSVKCTRFDPLYYSLRMYQGQQLKASGYTDFSLAENTCLYKHLILYEGLGVAPFFTFTCPECKQEYPGSSCVYRSTEVIACRGCFIASPLNPKEV